MILGSYCSSELLAHIVYEKFCKAVPLHRQEKDLKSKGIPLLKATLSNWVCYAAEKWCAPIVQNMKEKLLAEKIIHADETVFQVLHEEGRKATTNSRMWVYCNGKINDRSNIIFDYHPTRKSENAVRYTLNEKKYLYTFLEDGNVPIDNNRAENAIRPFAVGRKNRLFNDTARGAKCSAVLYSMIPTAQANGLDVEKYLTDLFSNSTGTILLPWNN